MGKRKEGEGRRQATDFKEAVCCPSAVVQGAARQKNGLCEGSALDNWDPREGQQPFRPNPNGVGDRTTTLRRLLIGAIYILLAYQLLGFQIVLVESKNFEKSCILRVMPPYPYHFHALEIF